MTLMSRRLRSTSRGEESAAIPMEGGFTAAPRGKLPIRPSEPSPQPLYVSRWKEAAKKNGWKWIATRPGVIIGTSKVRLSVI